MQSHSRNFPLDVNFDFGTTNLLVEVNPDEAKPFPPVAGDFELLDGTPFLLLDGTNFLLL